MAHFGQARLERGDWTQEMQRGEFKMIFQILTLIRCFPLSLAKSLTTSIIFLELSYSSDSLEIFCGEVMGILQHIK